MSLFRTPYVSPYYGMLESEASGSVKEPTEEKHSLKNFDFVAVFAHIFGITMLVLACYMYGTNGSGLQFGEQAYDNNGTPTHGNLNFHGIFMTSSFIFLQGEALIAYRVFRYEPKVLSKSVHVLLHLCVLGLGSLGIVSIVKEKRIHNYTNMFSFHSWIGVSIIAAYGIQAIIGFVSFVFPKIRMDFREAVMPFHRFLGRIIFATSVAQALIGNSMYWFFTFETGAQGISCYYDLACPKHVGVILNFYVITMVCYAICVGLMIGKDSWRRQPTLDEKKNQ